MISWRLPSSLLTLAKKPSRQHAGTVRQPLADVSPDRARVLALKWLLAPVSVSAAFLVTLLLRRFHSAQLLEPVFLAAVVVTVWYGGTGPGLVAGILSTLTITYFFLAPLHTLTVRPEDTPYLLVFVLFAFLTGWFSSIRRRALGDLEQARRELEIRVAERTADLEQRNQSLQAEMTERRRAELALQETRAELAHVARVTAMGELTASIAHEINQPLAAVVTNANACSRLLASSSPDLNEVREAVTDIAEAGTRAGNVISRVRGLLKKASPERTTLNINQVVQEVLVLARAQLERERVTVRTRLSDEPPPVIGDRIQLQQVVLNLVMNSLEAMASTPSRTLVVSSCADGAGVRVAVRDSGVGLDSADKDRIFDAFFTTKSGGLGMGLAIARSIVEAHGGRLGLMANQGSGATFEFWLPAASRTSAEPGHNGG